MRPKIIERSQRMPNRRYGNLLPAQDVALVLDDLSEFDVILPAVLDHLRDKRRKTFTPKARRLIGERIAQVEVFQGSVALGQPNDLAFELTPREAEAAAQRLSVIPTEKPGSPEDFALVTRARAAVYISQNLGLGWNQVCITAVEQQPSELPMAA